MHDANHRSYSKNQKVNKILSLSLYLLGGFPPTWQYQHNTLHHGFTNIDDHDEDIDPGKILRLSPNKPHFKYHRFQQWYAWFLYGLMTITWSIDKDFKQLFRYKNEGITNHAKKSFGSLLTILIASKIFYYLYILVLPMLLLPVPWWTVFIFYFIMHFISGVFLGMIFQTAHVMPSSEFPLPDDEGNIENNWAIHQLLTTTDYAPNSKFFSWFVGGLNFQIEHHLFPNICHVHYKKIRPIVEEKARQYNLPYYVQPTFPAAVKDHFYMLKDLGSNKLVMA
jgi:linoleoyl-CoA desaturase